MHQKTWLETMKERIAEEEPKNVQCSSPRPLHAVQRRGALPAQVADGGACNFLENKSLAQADEGESLEQYEAEALALFG